MGVDESQTSDELLAPFPYFGGKRRVAALVWSRLGNVDTYNEPFAGSLAVLLGRPHAPRIETVNDVDALLANFWRALRWDPEHVAFFADAPVNETDLHARHRWLTRSRKARAAIARVKADPDFFDAKLAGWWVWGQCLWIGSGWCNGLNWQQKIASEKTQGPIHRRWQGGGQGGGSGVHAPRLTEQKPHLSANRNGGPMDHGLLSQQRSGQLYDYLGQLSVRLRRVRVCCGDWLRILTPSVTTYVGTCGVFLDPPYAHELRERCYAEDHDISDEVRTWAIAHGDDPAFRIALCGYEGEHEMPASWDCVAWKAHGGYSRSERGVANRERERIWFSPHCERPSDRLPFD